MNLFSFAFRNISRKRQRTVITVGAMAFAGAIMIFYSAIVAGWLETTERNVVSMELGEVQIHAPGYRDDPDLYTRIDNVKALLAAIDERGYRAAPRLYAFALVAADDNSAGVRLCGVDLAREPEVTTLDEHLLSGRWLDSADPQGVVLGRKLARTLGVGLGSEVVVVGQASDGSVANALYSVRGILKSVGEGIDRSGFFMTAQAFRVLMVLPHGAHEIAIRSPDPDVPLDRLVSDIKALAPGYEVKSWRQLQPVVARLVDISNSALMIMLVITYSAVGTLTLNAMLMSVFERIREFGVLKALGTAPASVFWLIVLETGLQISAAVFLALATGVPLAVYFESHPIDFSAFVSSSSSIAGVALDPTWYCRVTAVSVVMPVAFMYLVGLGAVIYPAAKAALIRPVEAITYR